jgi:hypothetical protein
VIQGQSSKRVGLLLAEHVVNLPPEVATPLHVSLHAELAGLRHKYDQFLILSILCTRTGTGEKVPAEEGQGSKQEEEEEEEEEKFDDEPFMLRAADECYARAADAIERWHLPQAPDGNPGSLEHDVEREHVLMLVRGSKIEDVLTDMQDAFTGAPEAQDD